MTVLITGANRGIGLSIAELFGKTGYDGIVIIASRSLDAGKVAVNKLNSLYRNTEYHTVQLDITNAESRKSAIESVKTTYGSIKVLINNAGYAPSPRNTPFEEAAKAFDVNYFGTKAFTEEIMHIVTERIINVGSRAGNLAYKRCSAEVQSILTSMENNTTAEIDDMAKEFIEQTKDGTHNQSEV